MTLTGQSSAASTSCWNVPPRGSLMYACLLASVANSFVLMFVHSLQLVHRADSMYGSITIASTTSDAGGAAAATAANGAAAATPVAAATGAGGAWTTGAAEAFGTSRTPTLA